MIRKVYITILTLKPTVNVKYRPLAGYGLPPPRGNFADHIFLKAQCLARILQHVSPLTMAALSCNSLLHTLPYKIFDNYNNKVAKIRNRYNQVPHLTQDTNGKVTNSQKTPQTRAKRSALSQQVTTKHI